jgi:hypothetical protein
MAEAKVPRKYWWVVAVAVPVAVALIAVVPGLFKPSGPGGGTNTTINGNNNTVNFDYSTNNTFVTNAKVIAREFELQTGRPLSDDLRQQITPCVRAVEGEDRRSAGRRSE